MRFAGLFILATLFGVPAFAQQSAKPQLFPPPPQRLSIERAPPARVHAAFDFELGFAEYPVLEMPMSRDSSVRVDGSNTKEDLISNRGLLIGVELSRKDRTGRVPYSLGIGGLRAASPPGAGIPTPASYVRLFIQGAAEIPSGLNHLKLIPGLEARRSMYRNVDSGHYIDAMLVKAGLSYRATETVLMDVHAGYAPLATFGISQASGPKKSGALADTDVKVSEFSSGIQWSPESSISFQAGLAQETTLVTIRDMNSYRAYGLPAAPLEDTSGAKTYDLTVRHIRFGTTKHF